MYVCITYSKFSILYTTYKIIDFIFLNFVTGYRSSKVNLRSPKLLKNISLSLSLPWILFNAPYYVIHTAMAGEAVRQ